jgi:nucleotide-binding universal stress UspA family protein
MRMQSILVAMDLDEPAIVAARWAAEQFAPSANVTLLHVIDPPDRPRFSGALLPEPNEIEDAAREYAATRLRDIASLRLARPARIEIRVGKPHEQVVAVAREIGADLVVIGPHGDRPRPSRFLGTTAERIVRTSPVPVLVGTNPPAGHWHRILVAVDDADITPTLLRWARDLAEQFDADIKLLHVWSNALYSHVASMSYATATNEAEARAEIERELRDAGTQWLREMARAGIGRERVSATVTYGRPGEVTLEVAAAMNADLIIIGRRGTGLVAPAFLGSTVGTVLHGARRPVLVIAEARE